jgi:hypothetical protein
MQPLSNQPTSEGHSPLEHVHIEEHGKAHEPWHLRLLWISVAAAITCLVALTLNSAIRMRSDFRGSSRHDIRQWISAASPFAALTIVGDETEYMPLIVGPLGYVLEPNHNDDTAIHGEIFCSSHHHGVGTFELHFDATNRVTLLLKFNDGISRRLELETTR